MAENKLKKFIKNESCSIVAPATQALSADECVLSLTQKVPARWEEIIDRIKRGHYKPNIGDKVSCELKDGRKVDFVITDVSADAVRFESRDCLGEKVKYSRLDKYCERIFNLLPDALQSAIMPTKRKWLDMDGNIKTGTYKLFVPSSAEITPDDRCIGDKSVYEQPEWYKDRHHRIRFDEKDGDICWYWTRPAHSCNSTHFAIVYGFGFMNDVSASVEYVAPICFRIPRVKTTEDE